MLVLQAQCQDGSQSKGVNLQVNYKILTIPSVFIGVAEIPSPTVESLNSYLDKFLQDEGRLSRADSLVGQIRHGE